MEDLADDGLARLAPLDHVAYRSFAHEDYGVEGVCEVFERLGWTTVDASEGGRLEFTEKRVRARWLKPPKTPRGETPLPRIFVSELVVDACDEELKGYLTQHFKRVGEGKVVKSMEWASGAKRAMAIAAGERVRQGGTVERIRELDAVARICGESRGAEFVSVA